MRRLICAAAIVIGVAATACGSGSTAQPTPRPLGHRGTLLNPIDKSRSTVDQLNQQQSNEEQRTGGGAGYP